MTESSSLFSQCMLLGARHFITTQFGVDKIRVSRPETRIPLDAGIPEMIREVDDALMMGTLNETIRAGIVLTAILYRNSDTEPLDDDTNKTIQQLIVDFQHVWKTMLIKLYY